MCIFWWVSTINGNGRKVGQRKIKSGYIICRNLEQKLGFLNLQFIPWAPYFSTSLVLVVPAFITINYIKKHEMWIIWWVSTIHCSGRKGGQRDTKSSYIICRILRLLHLHVSETFVDQCIISTTLYPKILKPVSGYQTSTFICLSWKEKENLAFSPFLYDELV